MGSVHDPTQRADAYDQKVYSVENQENNNFQQEDNENIQTYESNVQGSHKRQHSYLTKGFKISRHER